MTGIVGKLLALLSCAIVALIAGPFIGRRVAKTAAEQARIGRLLAIVLFAVLALLVLRR